MAQTATVTYVSQGAASITASCEGINSAPVGVSVGPGVTNAAFPSLPAGYSTPAGSTITNMNPPAAGNYFIWQNTVSQRSSSAYNPVGATAPRNCPSGDAIGEILYPAGFPLAGNAPGILGTHDYSANGWTGFYLSVFVQLSSNWVSHPSGVNKVITGTIHSNPCFVISATSASYWEFRLQNLWQNPAGGQNVNGGQAAKVTKGLWQRLETQAVANTPGVANGIVRLWLSNYNSAGQLVSGPTKLIEATDVGWSSGAQANKWQNNAWNPIYGGTASGTLAAQQYMWMGQMAYGGKV